MAKRGESCRELVPAMLAMSAQGLNDREISERLAEMGHDVHRRTVYRWLKREGRPSSAIVEQGKAAIRQMRTSRDTEGPAERWFVHLDGIVAQLREHGKTRDAIGLASLQTAGELAHATADLAADIVETEGEVRE